MVVFPFAKIITKIHRLKFKSSQKYVDAICFVIDKRIEQLQQQGIEISDIKIVKDPNDIPKYIPKYKTKPCKYCGQPKDQGGHKYCKRYRILSSLIHLGFDESVIGTDQFEKEFERIIELIRSEYWDKKLTLDQIAKKYNLNDFSTTRDLMRSFNIPRR